MSSRLPFTEAEIESSLIARWRRVVEHFPQEIAVSTVDGEQYSYQAIDCAANVLAQALLAALGPSNGPIILLLGHSPAMIISILATLKANKAYVALDPTQTAGQLQLLRETAAAPVIVTNQTHQALAQAIATPAEQVWLLEELPTTDLGSPDMPILPDAIAGIFFTSGTINRPKGIPRSHRTILHRIWFSTNLCHFGPGHHISGIRQCGLGGGVADVFNSLLNGATYCIYPLQTDGLQGLSTWLQAEKITYFHPPIILFRQWLDTLAADDLFPHLRQILPSGRKSSADLMRLWPHVSEECIVLTSYSSTETTEITCTVLNRFTPTDEGVLHVGQPLPGKTVLVMSEDGQPVAVGEVGEIVVRSRYIAAGYWREPALTAQRFRLPEDGNGEICYYTGDLGRRRSDGYIELIGRRDSQVKLRGYRVVLSEVEDALQALPSIKAAVVTADEERGLLLAYVIAAIDPPAPPAAIRSALAERLPHYSLPTHFIYLTHFPLLASGKVNRQALPALEYSRPALETPYVSPRIPLEETLVAIWEALLDVRPIGIIDHFLDLGGNSLRAMRLMVEIERALGLKGSLSDFFKQPTIAHLAHNLQCGIGADLPPTGAVLNLENRVDAIKEEEAAVSHSVLTLSPEQELVFKEIYTQIGQPETAQSWRKPHRMHPSRRHKVLHFFLNRLPYGWAIKLLGWYMQQPWVQRRFFHKQVTALEQFLTELDGPHNKPQTIAHYLLFGYLHHFRFGPWRHRAESAPPAYAKDWVQVTGTEIVEQALAQKQGVILLRTHTNGSFYFHALPFKSYRVGQLKRHLPELLSNDAAIENTLFSHLLNTARQVLESGGIINLSADGRHGTSGGIEYNFHGRQRSFHTSFAEMALLTGAAVVAVDIVMQRDGHVNINFHGPLSAGAAHEPYATRVERLVAQYVALCQTTWRTQPAMIPWYQLVWHLAAPSWES